MTPELWQRVSEVLADLERLDPPQRAAELAQLRRSEPEVAAEVESLLRQQDTAGLDLERAADEAWAAVDVSAEPPQELPPHLGPYRIQEQIGKGGMGVVYRVKDRLFKRSLAVKVLAEKHRDNADLKRRFLEEAQLMGQLQHPGIPPVHDLGELPDGRPYFAMKLIKGRTLAALLQERTGPDQDQPRLLGIFLQVCQTVAYAHEQGIIHRDLKPANVMVGAFGEVQVMDWGLAKVLAAPTRRPAEERAEDNSTICTVRTETPDSGTQAGQVMGTLAYMAPEQARGETDRLDERCDVFALGAILCEILTGEPPFRGCILRDVQEGNTAAALARLEHCPAEGDLVELTRRCLAANREGRPPHGGAVRQALRAYLDGVQERLRREEIAKAAAEARLEAETKRRLAERQKRRMTVGLAAAVLLLVVAGGGAAWMLQQQQLAAAVRRQQADKDTTGVLERARGLLNEGWKKHELAILLEAKAEGDRATDIARTGEASPAMQQEAAAFLAEVQERLELAKKNRALLDALLDVSMPAETASYRTDDSGRAVALAQLSAEDQYGAAFRRWGLDVNGASEVQLVQRFQQEPEPVIEGVVAGLDNWMLERRRQERSEAESRRRFLGIATLVPGDAERQKHRETEWRRLFQVAEQLDPSDQRRQLRAWLIGGPPRPESVAGLVGVCPSWLALWDLARGDQWRRLQELRSRMVPTKEPVLTVLLLAGASSDIGDEVGAEQVLGQALAARPDQEVLAGALGRLLERQGRLPEAIGCYRAVRFRRPQMGVALGKALMGAGRAAKAEVVLRDLVGQQPQNLKMYFYLGNALHDQKNLDEAVVAYCETIKLQPDHFKAYNNLGIVLAEQGKLDEAAAFCRKAIELDPNNPAAYTVLGFALYKQGKLVAAEAACRKAIEIKPDYPSAHSRLGNVLAAQGKLDAAVATYHKAIEIKPDFEEPYTNLGNVLAMQGKLNEAEAFCRKAIDLAPDWAVAHNNLGVVLAKQEKQDEAVAAYRKASQLKPQARDAACNLGVALFKQAEFVEALAQLKKCHDLLPPGDPGRGEARQLISRCERLAALEARLPAVLKGAEQPANPAEQLAFAEMCGLKKLFAAAARFYRDGFAADPRLAEDMQRGNRYNAACSAALAGCGRGKDADTLDDKKRGHWRQQALDWLRADLNRWRKQFDEDRIRASDPIRQVMQHWQTVNELAGVREKEALDKLPEDERKQWQKLWADVDALRRRAANDP